MRNTSPLKQLEKIDRWTDTYRQRVIREHLATDYSKADGVVSLKAKQVVPVLQDGVPMVSTEFGNLSVLEALGQVEVLSQEELAARCAEARSLWTENDYRNQTESIGAIGWEVPSASESFISRRRMNARNDA